MSFDDEQEPHGRSLGDDRPDVPEPTVLPVDFPGPVRWDPVLGPGGEELGDGLVPMEGPPPAAESPGAEPRSARRRPRSGPRAARARAAAARTASRHGLPAPVLRVLLAATGLVGVAAILVTVVFASHGATPAGRDAGQRAAAPDVPGSTRPSAAAVIDASSRLQDRIELTARRERAIALRKRERARKRDRQRRAQTAPRSAPVTTQVVASPAATPEPARSPWPGVSPAEREFTPGPWNLS